MVVLGCCGCGCVATVAVDVVVVGCCGWRCGVVVVVEVVVDCCGCGCAATVAVVVVVGCCHQTSLGRMQNIILNYNDVLLCQTFVSSSRSNVSKMRYKKNNAGLLCQHFASSNVA